MNENLHIVCANCGATNRIPSERLVDNPNCGKCSEKLFTDKPITLGENGLNGVNIHKPLQKNDVLTVVDFWASWCQPCIHMAPQFVEASKQLPQVVFAKLQTDKHEQASVPYNIRSLPTLVAFKSGKEVARISGAMPAGKIVQWVNGLL